MCDEITSGYTKDTCKKAGGISSTIPIRLSSILTYTVVDGVVTALTTNETAFRISLDINSGFFNETPTTDRGTGSLHYPQTAQLMLKDNRKSTVQLVNKLHHGCNAYIAEYRDGTRRLFGAENGMTPPTTEGTSGTQGIDMNGNTVNLAGDENTYAPYIEDEAIITALLTPHS